jgi:hypothetical protein
MSCVVSGTKKVKCTLVRVLRLCTGRTAHRGSRSVALLFLDHGTRRVEGVSVTPRPRERPDTHCTGGWVGPRTGLDGWNNLVPTEIPSRAVEPAVSRYID